MPKVECRYFQDGGSCDLAMTLAAVRPEFRDRVRKWMTHSGFETHVKRTEPEGFLQTLHASHGFIYLCQVAEHPELFPRPCPGMKLRSPKELTTLF